MFPTKTKKTPRALEPGMASQLKLELIRLVQERDAQAAKLDGTRAKIEAIENQFGDTAEHLLARWGYR
jgi:hypothetical protein